MALAPRFRMGPPPRSFAADADDCIMVGIPSGPPNTSLWRDVRARWRAPLGPSRREDRASGHEIEEETRHHAPDLTRKAPYKCNKIFKTPLPAERLKVIDVARVVSKISLLYDIED